MKKVGLDILVFTFFIMIFSCYTYVVAEQIVFVANIDSNWDIFIMKDDGSHCKQLTKTPFDERFPCISNDRNQIVYSLSDGNLGIINLKNKNKEILQIPEGPFNHPRWLSKGKSIIFTAFSFDGLDKEGGDLWQYDIESKALNKTLKQSGTQLFPTCSESGKIIYSLALSGPQLQISHQIWIYNSEKQKANQLFIGHYNDIHPDISPNEDQIVFASDRAGKYDLWLFYLIENRFEQLTDDLATDMNPVFSPDGKKVLFISNRTGHYELLEMNLLNRRIKSVLPFGDKNVEIREPYWR